LGTSLFGVAAFFHTRLFGTEPIKVKPDYAKFLLDEPGLNFTLNLRDQVKGNQVNHFGFQVEREEEIAQHRKRLEESGITAHLEEENTTCCYAVQNKFWVSDPDGNEWEFFFVKEDADVHSLPNSSQARSACC
jgi:hypothetical protein